MYVKTNAANFQAFFLPMSQRPKGGCIYRMRIAGSNPQILDEIWQYHQAAQDMGIILEGPIPNPDERQMAFLLQTAGEHFQADALFIEGAMRKCLPKMRENDCRELSRSLCGQLLELQAGGKTESMLKNIYFKWMCWLYFRYEPLFYHLGNQRVPKILFESPSITLHEWLLLKSVTELGADALLIEPKGDRAYLKLDPESRAFDLLYPNTAPFPDGFCLKNLRKERHDQTSPNRSSVLPAKPAAAQTPVHLILPSFPGTKPPAMPGQAVQQPAVPDAVPSRFPMPSRSLCTNTWMEKPDYLLTLLPMSKRGEDPQKIYNLYVRVRGVCDKQSYLKELYEFSQQLEQTGRNIVIVNKSLPVPSPKDLQRIRRRSYRTADELIRDMALNLPSHANLNLQRLMEWAFINVMQKAAEEENNPNRLVVTAAYILCWVMKYQPELFCGYKGGENPCFILMGECVSGHDAAYIRFLSLLPVDVLIFAPDTSRPCTLRDPELLEIRGEESIPLMPFPRDTSSLEMRTTASYAEQELGGLLGRGGLYRDRQFSRAESMTLHCTYDEIFILWNQELKYRPNFSAGENGVHMPVIYAKVCGVEGGNEQEYWKKIKQLMEKDEILVKQLPFHTQGMANPWQKISLHVLKDGILNRDALKNDPNYPFALLRAELQEHILDKLELMLNRRLIKGTFVNGMEYRVVAAVLGLEKELLRELQSFDFTKRNPKLVCIHTGDQAASLEDAILFTFLNLVGFDIVLFVPTGYQVLEQYLTGNDPVEYQEGAYLYDLNVPDFASTAGKNRSWLENILRRVQGL